MELYSFHCLFRQLYSDSHPSSTKSFSVLQSLVAPKTIFAASVWIASNCFFDSDEQLSHTETLYTCTINGRMNEICHGILLFSMEFVKFSMDSTENHQICRGFYRKLPQILRNKILSVENVFYGFVFHGIHGIFLWFHFFSMDNWFLAMDFIFYAVENGLNKFSEPKMNGKITLSI